MTFIDSPKQAGNKSKKLQDLLKTSDEAQTEELVARIAALGAKMRSSFAEGLQRIQFTKQAAINNQSGLAEHESSSAIGPDHPVMQVRRVDCPAIAALIHDGT